MLYDTLNRLDTFDPKDYLTKDTYQFYLTRLDTIVSVLGKSLPDTAIDRVANYIGEHQLESITKCPCWENGHWFLKDHDTCNGTKEREPCKCGGDRSKCDHYPEKRGAENDLLLGK